MEKLHPITIRVSVEMLAEIDRRILDRRPVRRHRLVLDTVEVYLSNSVRPALDIDQTEPKITHAIAESTDRIKTGRYEQ